MPRSSPLWRRRFCGPGYARDGLSNQRRCEHNRKLDPVTACCRSPIALTYQAHEGTHARPFAGARLAERLRNSAAEGRDCGRTKDWLPGRKRAMCVSTRRRSGHT
jgi:hypothetical protein